MIYTITPQSRKAICARIMAAPAGWSVRISEQSRNLEQNAKLWALLKDVSEQVPWYGEKLTDENWKDVFTAGLKQSKVVPGLEVGFVVLGQHTSSMSKSDFSELTTMIVAFGDDHGVKWSENDIPVA